MADRGRGRGRGASTAPRGRGGAPGGISTGSTEKPKREAILDLSKYSNQEIRVKFTGGREGIKIAVIGVLKGYDQLLNLVLDDVEETIQDPEPHIRKLGLVVLRGPTITIISPTDGSAEIENPFVGAAE